MPVILALMAHADYIKLHLFWRARRVQTDVQHNLVPACDYSSRTCVVIG